jgi:TPR repeat protein
MGLAHYFGEGVAQDYAAAADWFDLAASQGNAEAMNTLGHLYDTGRGVGRDLGMAFALFDRAARLGHATAQVNLAWYLSKGMGTAPDLPAAAMWAEIGVAGGRTHRAYVAEEMRRRLPPDVAAALPARVEACVASGYSDC